MFQGICYIGLLVQKIIIRVLHELDKIDSIGNIGI